MRILSNRLEAKFMNELPVSLRPGALEVYKGLLLKEVLEIRIGQVPASLSQFNYSPEQWRKIGNAVVLTKCSEITLTNHLTYECLRHLHKVVASALNMPNAPLADIYRVLQVEAPNLAGWVLQLHKLLKPV